MSGHDHSLSRTACYASGVDCFLAKPFGMDEILAVAWSLARRGHDVRNLEEGDAVVDALASLQDGKGLVSYGHMHGSARLARAFGQALGLHSEDLLVLHRAGDLHDVGKVDVDDRIVRKKGPLSPRERQEMQWHAALGARICSRFRSLAPVFQVADVYDALTSRRCYKDALSRGDAIAVQRAETDQGSWDPELVTTFIELCNGDFFGACGSEEELIGL